MAKSDATDAALAALKAELESCRASLSTAEKARDMSLDGAVAETEAHREALAAAESALEKALGALRAMETDLGALRASLALYLSWSGHSEPWRKVRERVEYRSPTCEIAGDGDLPVILDDVPPLLADFIIAAYALASGGAHEDVPKAPKTQADPDPR